MTRLMQGRSVVASRDESDHEEPAAYTFNVKKVVTPILLYGIEFITRSRVFP